MFLTRTIARNYKPDELRLYCIARAEFHKVAGWFSITELLDVLNLKYGFDSLHRGPGNGRAKYRRRLAAVLDASPLFFHGGPKYRVISWRKLGNTKATRLDVPAEALQSQRAFNDHLVSTVAHSRHVSADALAAELGISRGGLYAALKRLEASGELHKVHNLALSPAMTAGAARAARSRLYSIGINTELVQQKARPAIFTPFGRGAGPSALNTHIAYYLPNYYGLGKAARGLKDIAPLPFPKRVCRFIRMTCEKAFMVAENMRLYEFNDAFFTENDYIQNYGREYAVA